MARRKAHEVLGVDENATGEEVRAAFRRRAKELHPDRKGEAGRAPFEEARQAYEELASGRLRREGRRGGDAGEVPVRVKPAARRSFVEPLRPSDTGEPVREWIRPLDTIFRRFR